jgi:hypothetical protein
LILSGTTSSEQANYSTLSSCSALLCLIKTAMRIATYNVENLFSRVRAMNSDDPDKTTVVLADVAERSA